MTAKGFAFKSKSLALAMSAAALALVMGLGTSGPAQAEVLLLAAGGGGGAAVGVNGGAGQAGPNGSDGSSFLNNGSQGAGGINGGGGRNGTAFQLEGAGGAGWNGNGGIGSNSLAVGGFSRPLFLGGDGAAVVQGKGNNSGGFGGGGGGGGLIVPNIFGIFTGGGGGGGGGYSGGGGGGSAGVGGGGGSYIAAGALSPLANSGVNGVPNALGGVGSNGFVIIQPVGQIGTVFDYTGATQNYIAPTTGLYTIEAFGAQGGSSGDGIGGYGAGLIANFSLTAGTDLFVVVGQAGFTGDLGERWGGGGGGGSFVWEPLVTLQTPAPLPGCGLASLAVLVTAGSVTRLRRTRS